MVVVLVRWRRHPKVSLVATLGLVLIVLHALFFAAADVWVPRLFLDKGSLGPDRFYAIFGLIASLTLAIAFAVLLIAIFMDREPGEREL
jgi:drug/metabolite transporter (DMT)-like permease